MIEFNEHILEQIFEVVTELGDEDAPSDESVVMIADHASETFAQIRLRVKDQGDALTEAFWRVFMAGFLYRDALQVERDEEYLVVPMRVSRALIESGKFVLHLRDEGEE